MADDKQERIETLQDRVDELEATVSKMLPSRRDALKLGAAGAVGAVGMAGSASAQNSGQTGTIGTDSDRVDVNAEDIDAVSVNTGSLSVASTRDADASVFFLKGGAPTPSSITVTETKVGDAVVGKIDMELSGSVAVDHRWDIKLGNSYVSEALVGVGQAMVYDSLTNNNLGFFDITTRAGTDDGLFVVCNRVNGSLDYSGGLSGSYVMF